MEQNRAVVGGSRGGEHAAQEVAKPVIPSQLEHLAKLSADLSHTLAQIDAGLCRLTNPTPRPVRDDLTKQPGNPGSISVEAALGVLTEELSRSLHQAQELAQRLNRAV